MQGARDDQGGGSIAAADALTSALDPEATLDSAATLAPAVGETGWSVGKSAARLGVSASTLRSWEVRYGLGPSVRTEGGHRRYSDADVDRLRLMVALIGNGVSTVNAARNVASLPREEVARRLATGVADQAPVPTDADTVVAICSATAGLDGATLHAVYRRLLRRADLTTVWASVVAPALERIGLMWDNGQIGIEHEHLASEVLSDELRSLTRVHGKVPGATVVLASASEDQHHLPLLALEAELTRRGIGTILLGAQVPKEALTGAVVSTSAAAVFLWATLQRGVDDPVWSALSQTGRPLTAVVGGPGWPEPVTTADQPGLQIRRVADLRGAVAAVSAAVGGGSPARA